MATAPSENTSNAGRGFFLFRINRRFWQAYDKMKEPWRFFLALSFICPFLFAVGTENLHYGWRMAGIGWTLCMFVSREISKRV